MKTFFVGSYVLLLCVVGSITAADWDQWRGPGRDGLSTEKVELVDTWKGRPRELWRSEKIVSEGEGGFSSVIVADGRAYLYVNWEYKVPIQIRKLSAGGLKKLGWSDKMPQDVREKVEQARVSEERSKLDRKEVRKWVNAWIKEQLSKENRRWKGMVQRRLIRGDGAIPVETLKLLDTIKGREFASEEELDAWLDENEIPEDVRKRVKKVIPTDVTKAHDVFLCLDAETGKTIWKTQEEGRAYGWPSSSTACVENGRVYVLGSNAMAYCLDAGSGDIVWKVQSSANAGANASSSFLVADGKAMVMGGPLMAFDAETGKSLWTQKNIKAVHSSPVLWNAGEKDYVLCHTGGKIICVDPADGKILWNVPGGGGNSSPVVSGNHMAVVGNKKNFGLRAYKLSPEKPEQLWSVEFQDRGTSPLIYRDHVYAFGGRGKAVALSVELESGQIRWESKIPNTEFSSPVGADGKIIAVVGRQLYMVDADSEEFEVLARANLGITRCVSPALVGGRAYLRLRNAVACYEINKR